MHIHSLHSEFFPTLVNKMIRRLADDALTIDSELCSRYDSSYASCLSRWMLWVVETSESENQDNSLRVEASAMLITTVQPGAEYIPSGKKMQVPIHLPHYSLVY